MQWMGVCDISNERAHCLDQKYELKYEIKPLKMKLEDTKLY